MGILIDTLPLRRSVTAPQSIAARTSSVISFRSLTFPLCVVFPQASLDSFEFLMTDKRKNSSEQTNEYVGHSFPSGALLLTSQAQSLSLS